MASVGVRLLIARDWKYASISLSAFVAGLIPFVVNRFSSRIKLPIGFIFLYVLFIFLSYFLGEVFGLYGRIAFWDATLHFASGVLLVLAAVWWVRALARHHLVKLPMWCALIFAVCLSVTGAALWESVEFLSDQWFGTYSQDGGLPDTMDDIVANVVASILTAFGVAAYARRRPQTLMERLLRKRPNL